MDEAESHVTGMDTVYALLKEIGPRHDHREFVITVQVVD